MSSPAFPPETPSSALGSETASPALPMPPENDVTPPPAPPSLPPATVTSPPSASPSLPQPTPPLPSPSLPVSPTPPPPLPQPPISAAMTPPLPLPPPEPSSPLPPSISPPSPVTVMPSQPLPSPPSLKDPLAPVVTNPPQFTPPSPPWLKDPPTQVITNPPQFASPPPSSSSSASPTTPQPEKPTPTTPSEPKTRAPAPRQSSQPSPVPRRESHKRKPRDPNRRVHNRPVFPPLQQASAPAASSLPPSTQAGGEMPLTLEPSAPPPGQPVSAGGVVVGGGGLVAQPPPSVLPIGPNMGSNLEAGVGLRSSSSSRVSTGVVVALSVGGVVLVLLVVFGILVVFFRKRMNFSGDGFGICKGNGDVEGKTSLPKYSMQNLNSEDHQILGSTASHIQQTTFTSQNAISILRNSASTLESSSSNPAMAMGFSAGTFTYEELLAATGGFSDSNLLGQGGFGYVHKGVLPSGKEVAVKQLKLGGQQGEKEFQAEVETISQVHHKHLVSLVGYCVAGAKRLLVYEFVPNKTLEFHLHGKDQPVMEWRTRLKIAIGSAKGLAYLHEDCNPAVIHRDIKAANILLHFNFEPKVSDFGLAKIFSSTSSSVTHITTRVVGTFGYLAPEYASSGKLTEKSDVYSYGVMLLELITGRPAISTYESEANCSLVNWARPLLAQAIEGGDFGTLVDPRLQHNYDANEMASMVACAAACVRLSAWRRPRMSRVVRALEGDLSPSDLGDGVRPGHSSMHFPYESLDFDAHRYMEEMKKFKMTLASNGSKTSNNNCTGSRGYSDSTSEYGLNPSISSSESQVSQSKTNDLLGL